MKVFLLAIAILMAFFHLSDGRFDNGAYQKYLYNKYPGLRELEQQRRAFRNSYVSTEEDIKSRREMTIWTIPVVVHIIYNTEQQNISDAVIFDQIAITNQDFRKLNSDQGQVLSQFTNLASDTGIQFILATEDPNGHPTNGITRTMTSTTEFVDPTSPSFSDQCKFTNKGGINAWDTTKYMNIWVCNFSGGTLGFTTTAPESEDGIVIATKYFGRNYDYNQPPFDLGRTVTHEMGHWVSLEHPWGLEADNLNCANDDLVADTPTTNAPGFECNLTRTSCGHLNMVQNFMDYADDSCMCLFTAGQVTRMRRELPDGSIKSRAMAFQYNGFVLGISTTGSTLGSTGYTTTTISSATVFHWSLFLFGILMMMIA